MARFDPYIDIEEGEIIEPPRKPPQQLKVDTTWRKSDKRLSPAREVKLRVEPYPASHTRSRSRGSTPIPKYQAPRNTGQTPNEIKIQLDEFIFKWEQKRDAQTEIPMRADGYARAVARLESLTVYRKVGKGTLEDPEVCSTYLIRISILENSRRTDFGRRLDLVDIRAGRLSCRASSWYREDMPSGMLQDGHNGALDSVRQPTSPPFQQEDTVVNQCDSEL